MNLVISDPNGIPLKQTDDFDLDLQYGEKCDFVLSLPELLEPHSLIHIDGTPFGGVVDKRCPSHTSKDPRLNTKEDLFKVYCLER